MGEGLEYTAPLRCRLAPMLAVCATVLTSPVLADPTPCPGGQVLTEFAGDDAALICDVATRATRQLSTCNLTVQSPVTISVSETLEANCLGLYHCGQDRIEIMPPNAYTTLLEGDFSGAFAVVSPAAFFESIVRHELTHAALESLPCPFESCLVGQEYLAYAMQVRFLPEIDRAAFEAVEPYEGPVPRDVLNPIILMMSPDLFARRAWQHLSERPDACAFVGQVARGEVLLDYERP